MTMSPSQVGCQRPKITNPSNNHNTIPPKKICKDKAKWTMAEEAAIITTCLNRKLLGMYLGVASSPLFGNWWSSQ